MADDSDALWAKMQRNMDFILEQQAVFSVRQAEFEEHTRRAIREHDRQMAAIDRRLSRAIKFSILEHRTERKRRRELAAEWNERMERLESKMEAFVDSLRRGGNGHQ